MRQGGRTRETRAKLIIPKQIRKPSLERPSRPNMSSLPYVFVVTDYLTVHREFIGGAQSMSRLSIIRVERATSICSFFTPSSFRLTLALFRKLS